MPDIFTSPKNFTQETNAPQPANTLTNNLTPATQPTNRSRLLSAYTFMPADTHFETQEPGETIILLLRKHFITNFPWLFVAIFLIITPLIIFPLISFSSILPPFVPPNFITFLILVWYLLTFGFILTEFLLWYFNVWIVTDERVVDIDFNNLLYKSVSETRISKIEDVTSKTGGFIRALFDYGDVFIQTAGTASENFAFYAVPHPADVVKVVNELMGKEEGEIGA